MLNTLSIKRRSLLQGSLAALVGAGLGPRFAQAQSADELSFWTPGGSELFCKIHTDLITGFAGSQKTVKGAAVTCGLGEGKDYAQTIVAAVTAGNAPDLSLWWDSPVVLGSQGAFLALDDLMKASTKVNAENWPPGLLKSCQFQGKTYGLPVTAGVFGMWYNEELFESKGMKSDRASLPKTWAEMRKLSKEFTKWNGDRLEVGGFLPPREPETIPIWSALNGGMIFDDVNLKYTIDSEQNVEMFNFFLDWLNEEYKGDVNLIDRSGNFRQAYTDTSTGLGPAFREGRQAGIEQGSWLMGDIYADPEPVFKRWNIGQHPVGPSGKTTVSGTWPNWFVIPNGSKHIAEAFAYMEYLSTEGVLNWYKQIPDIPTNKLVPQSTPDVVVKQRGQEFAKDVSAFLAKQVEIVTPMWNSPIQSFGQDQILRAMEKIYTKTASVKDALAEAQKASQGELELKLKG